MLFPYRLLSSARPHLTAIALALWVSTAHSLALEQIINDGILDQQRSDYQAATDAFKDNDFQRYKTLKTALRSYPLYPYLEYAELKQHLKNYRNNHKMDIYGQPIKHNDLEETIGHFLNVNQKSYLAKQLRAQWLNYLASESMWSDYKQYYQIDVKKTRLQCLYLHAKLQTSEDLPIDEVTQLWIHHKSQPKACNPVFSAWEKRGHLTDEILWQRYILAVKKNNANIADYVKKKMSPNSRHLADLFKDVHTTPSTIANTKQLPEKHKKIDPATSKKINDIMYHGLYHYSSIEPTIVLAIIDNIKMTHGLSNERINTLEKRVAKYLIHQDELPRAMRLITSIERNAREDLVERLLRKFLERQQWQDINRWIRELPEEQYASDRWQYWKAKTLELLNDNSYQKIYTRLSSSRSFYGFLAADKQNTDYALEDKPAPVDMVTIETVRQLPAIKRAKEFFALGEMHRARVEWSYAIKGFSNKEFIAAGQLAHLWGWNRKAIEAMAGAKYWDDLTIRFPIVHKNIVEQKAQVHNIPSSLIFSIARQESAWEFDATSRVGARGLMQIMPATAKYTAKKADITYKKAKLFEPEYNISLGSHYITGLLNQYNNNRALAIASYNAGPNRIKQWLARTKASLPLDVWIEIIPFKETRKYVQNVLSYEVIYNYRQGQTVPLLTLAEANASL